MPEPKLRFPHIGSVQLAAGLDSTPRGYIYYDVYGNGNEKFAFPHGAGGYASWQDGTGEWRYQLPSGTQTLYFSVFGVASTPVGGYDIWDNYVIDDGVTAPYKFGGIEYKDGGSEGGNLYLSSQSGVEKVDMLNNSSYWSWTTPDSTEDRFTIFADTSDNTVITATSESVYLIDDTNGNQQWSYEPTTSMSNNAVSDGSYVYAGDFSGSDDYWTLVKLDITDGSVVNSNALTNGTTTSLGFALGIADDGTLISVDADDVRRYDQNLNILNTYSGLAESGVGSAAVHCCGGNNGAVYALIYDSNQSSYGVRKLDSSGNTVWTNYDVSIGSFGANTLYYADASAPDDHLLVVEEDGSENVIVYAINDSDGSLTDSKIVATNGGGQSIAYQAGRRI